MTTFLIIALVILIAFALYKKVPLYGFYDMQTCIDVLLMAIISLVGVMSYLGINTYCFVFGFSLAVSVVCCYGIKSRYVCKFGHTTFRLL